MALSTDRFFHFMVLLSEGKESRLVCGQIRRARMGRIEYSSDELYELYELSERKEWNERNGSTD